MTTNNDDQPRVLVVMYHYIHDEPPAPASKGVGPHRGVRGLSASAFSEQLDELCRAMEPIDWPALHAWLNDEGDIPDRSFLLTFDDGLSDHAKHAAPQLEQRGLRGLFFVPGAVVEPAQMLSAHAVHLLLSRLGDERLEQELRARIQYEPDSDRWIRLLDERADGARPSNAYHYESSSRARLKTWLTLGLPVALRRRAISGLFETHIGPQESWARAWYLALDDVRALHARGHTIGGHGFAHEPLARMSPHELQEDLTRCAQTLTEILGPAVRPLSYPFGSFNESVERASMAAGFVHGFTTDSRLTRRSDCAMRLPRIDTIHVSAQLNRETHQTTCAPTP